MIHSDYLIPASLSANDIIHQVQSDPDENPWVLGGPIKETVIVVDYNPQWPEVFEELKVNILNAVGENALHIEHVGSTAVENLPAKPVIDIDLIVPDARREDTYIPQLEAIGYILVVREPSWYQHRCLRLTTPRVNLHVFSPETPEAVRHILFRNWLRAHADDRQIYADIKYQAIKGVDNANDYNRNKNDVVQAIYNRMFKEMGLL